MTGEIDIMRKTISEYESALRMKNMNEELLQHLSGSIFYLLKHSEKYNIPLPKKDDLVRMLEKANHLIDEITYQPRGNTDNYQPRSKQNLVCIVLTKHSINNSELYSKHPK